MGHGLVAGVPLSPLQATHALALLHTGVVALQSEGTLQTPQAPAFAPEVTQLGAATVGQGRAAADPKFPLQPAQVPCVGIVSQVGVAPVHAVLFDDVQTPQLFLPVSQRGWAPGQSLSRTQPPHWLLPRTAGVQTPAESPVPEAGSATPAAPSVDP